jgi:hypothetical protein
MPVIGEVGIRTNVLASFRVIRKKLKWNFQSIYDLKSFSFNSGYQETINILIYAAPEFKKGLHASIKNIVDVHWTCVCASGTEGGRDKIAETLCTKKGCRFSFCLVSETFLLDENAERHRNLIKMENQWREKLRLWVSFICQNFDEGRGIKNP